MSDDNIKVIFKVVKYRNPVLDSGFHTDTVTIIMVQPISEFHKVIVVSRELAPMILINETTYMKFVLARSERMETYMKRLAKFVIVLLTVCTCLMTPISSLYAKQDIEYEKVLSEINCLENSNLKITNIMPLKDL